MMVEGTCGHKTVKGVGELQQLFRSSRNEEFREFWLGARTFPALVIHTRGDLACLHFFPAEGHPEFQSVGGASFGDEVTFKQAGQGEFSMARASVVPIEQAEEAATEFFTTMQLPSCIHWTEL